MIDEWDPHRVGELEATLVQYEDGATECTIHPREWTDDQRTTAWLSAQDGSFCAVKDMR